MKRTNQADSQPKSKSYWRHITQMEMILERAHMFTLVLYANIRGQRSCATNEATTQVYEASFALLCWISITSVSYSNAAVHP